MYQEKRKDYGPRRNEYIRVPQVQLIGSKGENIGVVDTAKALSLAKEVGLDLVEVGAGINPPVCKIMDYSKYIYIQNKKTRQNKKGKLKETKEFRFSPVIDRADIKRPGAAALENQATGRGDIVFVYQLQRAVDAVEFGDDRAFQQEPAQVVVAVRAGDDARTDPTHTRFGMCCGIGRRDGFQLHFVGGVAEADAVHDEALPPRRDAPRNAGD